MKLIQTRGDILLVCTQQPRLCVARKALARRSCVRWHLPLEMTDVGPLELALNQKKYLQRCTCMHTFDKSICVTSLCVTCSMYDVPAPAPFNGHQVWRHQPLCECLLVEFSNGTGMLSGGNDMFPVRAAPTCFCYRTKRVCSEILGLLSSR